MTDNARTPDTLKQAAKKRAKDKGIPYAQALRDLRRQQEFLEPESLVSGGTVDMFETTDDALEMVYKIITTLGIHVPTPRGWTGAVGPDMLAAGLIAQAHAFGAPHGHPVAWQLGEGDGTTWTLHADNINLAFDSAVEDPEYVWSLPPQGLLLELVDQEGLRRYEFPVADPTPAADPSDRTQRVRAWAQGMYATEAAIELLARGPKPGMLSKSRPWVMDADWDDRSYLDVDALREHTGGWSSGETVYVDLALALLGGERFDLTEIARLDRHYGRLALAAIAHATGIYAAESLERDPAAEYAAILKRL